MWQCQGAACCMEHTSRQTHTYLMQHGAACVYAREHPVGGDTVDHAHGDWQCSTAEITNNYYAGE